MRIVTFLQTLILLCPLAINAQDKPTFTPSGDVIQQGMELHDKGKYKDAVELYKRVSRSDTNYVWALYEMGMSYASDSQYAKARQSYELALSLSEEREREPNLYTNYGSLLDDMGERERALRIFDSALKKYPAFSSLYLNKGLTLIRLEKYGEAEALLKQGLLIDPYSYSSHYLLGVAALYQGKVVPAFLSFVGYLMMTPDGRYNQTAIRLLTTIANNKEDLNKFMEKRVQQEEDPYRATEEIVLAKLALDKNYKPIIKLDDPISRQIQVLFEKLEYDEGVNDFWMQYYVPIFKSIYANKEFEIFVNHIFSDVNLKEIQDYNKKNKKEKQQLIEELVAYLNNISSTRELNYKKRGIAETHYYSKGSESGKGKWKNNGEIFYGPWEFYFKPGNLRSKGSYDDAGQREGEWRYYYYNGTLKGIERYKKGKLEGESEFFHTNGNRSYILKYKDGEEDGDYATYSFVGLPKLFIQYRKGKIYGERREYYDNGVIKSIETYRNDTLHGPYKSYHQNGEIKSAWSYSNGKMTGIARNFHENGKVSLEGNYLDDNAEGEFKRFHENGKLKGIEHYEKGEITGSYEEFHSNGVLYTKFNHKKGKMDGDISYFDDDGKLFVTEQYSNGILKSAKYFDKKGNNISSSELKNKKMELTSFRPDGSKRYQSVVNDKSEVLGRAAYFYPSGKQSETNEYENGKLNGPSISYHRNGKKNVEMFYEKGEKHGYYKSYYQHGQISSEGWYQNDQMEGEWTYYNEAGIKTSKMNAYHDELNGFKEEYYPNGRVEFDSKYKEGYSQQFIQYDSTGKVLTEIKLPKGSGKVLFLHHNGKPYVEYNMVNGLMEGVYKVYYPDGSLENLEYYRHGSNDSNFRSIHFNGNTYKEGKYKLGSKIGTWKTYRLDGGLNVLEQYENGELHGKKTFYFENGKVDTEVNYENGEKHGPTNKYTMDGILISVVNFDRGTPVSYTYPDASGKLLPNIEIKGGNGKVTTYYANGKPSSSYEYVDGKLNGPDMMYYPDGKPWMESTEDYGMTTGKLKTYYPSGEVKGEFNYKYGDIDGTFKEYYEKGILKAEGGYAYGFPHGETKYFDEKGKLKYTLVYYYGKIVSIKK